MTHCTRAIGMAACLLLAGTALVRPGAAQIYKWVDEKGTVHFSNDPPAKAPAEVLPENRRPPLVENGPDAPAEAAAAPAASESGHGTASDPVPEDVEPSEIVVEESDTIIVDDGAGDLATRRRANSPRNRPGQPIRQPRSQPRRGR